MNVKLRKADARKRGTRGVEFGTGEGGEGKEEKREKEKAWRDGGRKEEKGCGREKS